MTKKKKSKKGMSATGKSILRGLKQAVAYANGTADKSRYRVHTRMKNPPHPGEFIRTEVLEANKLSITEAAKRMGVPREKLSKLVNAKLDLSRDMAEHLELFFKVDAETLMRMQKSGTGETQTGRQGRPGRCAKGAQRAWAEYPVGEGKERPRFGRTHKRQESLCEGS
jgi:addiction module HigA family antidote